MIFISHSSKDCDLTERMYQYLSNLGHTLWVDTHNIEPGIPYARVIMNGVNHSNIMVVIITEQSLLSENVLNEIDQAHRLQMRIIPYLSGKIQLNDEFMYYLSRKQWIVNSGTDEDGFEILHTVIANYKHVSPPSFSRKENYWRSLLKIFSKNKTSFLICMIFISWGFSIYVLLNSRSNSSSISELSQHKEMIRQEVSNSDADILYFVEKPIESNTKNYQ